MIKRFICLAIFIAIFSAASFAAHLTGNNNFTFLAVCIFIIGIILAFIVTTRINNKLDGIETKSIFDIKYIFEKKKIVNDLRNIINSGCIDNIFIDENQKTHIFKKTYLYISKNKISRKIENKKLRRATLMIIAYIIKEEIIYSDDFIYRGIPGFKSSDNIKCYIRLVDYMNSEGLISEDEKNYALCDLKKELSTLG